MSTDNGSADDGATTNGHLVDDGKVRVAIVGVGNCANSFIQGVTYYQDADPAEQVPGLMHVDLGGYHVRDIEFVAAFDIDAEKVGKDLSEAIWSGQNDTIKFADVPELGVKVHRGMTHDGLGKYLKQKITKAPGPTDDVVGILRRPRRTCWSATCRSAPSRPRSGTSSRRSARASGSSTACRCSSPARTTGTAASATPGCRSSATTSSRRSARPSSTASSRGCSTTAGSTWTARRSSTSAATWTSSTCSSASAWTPRRSRRRTP